LKCANQDKGAEICRPARLSSRRGAVDGELAPETDIHAAVLPAVQPLLGDAKLESTVRYIGVEVDDALQIAEHIEL
jgi:hypothetical protein